MTQPLRIQMNLCAVIQPFFTTKEMNFGTFAEAFGGSFKNNAGLTWYGLRIALGVLLGAPTAGNDSDQAKLDEYLEPFSKYGTLVYQDGKNREGGYGTIYQGHSESADGKSFAKYVLDVSDITPLLDNIYTEADQPNADGQSVTLEDNVTTVSLEEQTTQEDATSTQESEITK